VSCLQLTVTQRLGKLYAVAAFLEKNESRSCAFGALTPDFEKVLGILNEARVEFQSIAQALFPLSAALADLDLLGGSLWNWRIRCGERLRPAGRSSLVVLKRFYPLTDCFAQNALLEESRI
jgi:hypothetical protein